MSEEKPADVLSKVLSYVDSPFKLFALILMAVFAFSGYFVWQNQAFLFEAYKENKKLPNDCRGQGGRRCSAFVQEHECGGGCDIQSQPSVWYKGVISGVYPRGQGQNP